MTLNLKNIRKTKKITVSDLASQVGISQSYLSHIENGRRPISEELADKIAKVLQVNPDDVHEAAKEVELPSDRLNSWIAYIRINQLPFVKAFGYYLKDKTTQQLKSEEEFKKLIIDFINTNLGTAVRNELEENPKLVKILLTKLEAITERKLM
jgi:transcriptional regulator with XRE-family HTH domain